MSEQNNSFEDWFWAGGKSPDGQKGEAVYFDEAADIAWAAWQAALSCQSALNGKALSNVLFEHISNGAIDMLSINGGQLCEELLEALEEADKC